MTRIISKMFKNIKLNLKAVVRRCSQMFFRMGVLTNFVIFTGTHLCWSFFLIKFIKKKLQHRCFPVKFVKFWRTIFKRTPLVVASVNLWMNLQIIAFDGDIEKNPYSKTNSVPNLIWVGFLGVRLGVGGKIIPLSKTCWYVTAHTYVVSENILFSTKFFLILLMSAFRCIKRAFFGKNSAFTQSNSVRAVLEIFQFCFQIL